ncbi:MAG: hypothetical protein ACRDT0_11115 [Pseudonocardiaceae bacterium]
MDRDLGRKAFPEGLRAAGMSVVTIAEHYGVEGSEVVEDETWMLEAAGSGWPVFCCDAKHRSAAGLQNEPLYSKAGRVSSSSTAMSQLRRTSRGYWPTSMR